MKVFRKFHSSKGKSPGPWHPKGFFVSKGVVLGCLFTFSGSVWPTEDKEITVSTLGFLLDHSPKPVLRVYCGMICTTPYIPGKWNKCYRYLGISTALVLVCEVRGPESKWRGKQGDKTVRTKKRNTRHSPCHISWGAARHWKFHPTPISSWDSG